MSQQVPPDVPWTPAPMETFKTSVEALDVRCAHVTLLWALLTLSSPYRFVDGNDDHVGVGKRNFAEFARVQADGVVKVEFQSRESPTTRDPAAVPVKTISGHGVVALPSKHRRKFAAPKR